MNDPFRIALDDHDQVAQERLAHMLTSVLGRHGLRPISVYVPCRTAARITYQDRYDAEKAALLLMGTLDPGMVEATVTPANSQAHVQVSLAR